jgi:uncharacterized protein YdeI (YjbR/CyaY-like superfamily)
MPAPPSQKKRPPAATYFAEPGALRDWLRSNAHAMAELRVGFYKLGSGRASITWPQAVDEALCVGWVDGVRHRIDEHRYQIRFTPRKSTSIWSAVNIERVRVLSEEGRMQPAGLAAFARRVEKKSRIYSYEQAEASVLSPTELKAFKRTMSAWAFFEAQPPGYRKLVLWRIVSAKQQSTRERRFAALVAASAKGVRM